MKFFENEIKEYAEFAWSTLDFKCTPSSEPFEESMIQPVKANIEISGQWQGVVTLSMDYDLAQQLADKMFSRERGQASDEEISDAASEMINMIGGNLKSLLPQPNQLSLPIIEFNQDPPRYPSMEQLSEVVFDCMEQKFMVTIQKIADKNLQNQPSTVEA